jgi:hypothetical protein
MEKYRQNPDLFTTCFEMKLYIVEKSEPLVRYPPAISIRLMSQRYTLIPPLQ